MAEKNEKISTTFVDLNEKVTTSELINNEILDEESEIYKMNKRKLKQLETAENGEVDGVSEAYKIAEVTKNQPSIGFIDETAEIADGVKIYPNVYILGNSKIGKGTVIYPNTTIENSVIGENCVIKSSFIEDSQVANNVQIGPFAHLRPNSVISDDCKIGNFVEIKNAKLGKNTKASHLAYVGDADVGDNCNIGCGAIFVNYNGKNKNRTIVEDDCFVGSNCNIVAPVHIKKGGYICAGTTLTVDTSEDDFVIGRCRETIKSNRAHKYLEKK